MQERQQPPGRFENTLDRIDRLYTQQEFDEALRRRSPAEALSETSTGHSLAALMDDLAQHHDDIGDAPARGGESSSNVDGSGAEFIDLSVLEATVAPAFGVMAEPKVVSIDSRQPLPAARIPAPRAPAASDELGTLLGDFEQRLRRHLEAVGAERATAIERGYRAKLEKVRETARVALQQREIQVKQRYEEHYRKKELALRDNYRKLMVLAQKIGEQKSQLQQARKQFDEKLQAANALYKQVEEMRRLLRGHLASPDDSHGGTSG